MAQSRHPHTHRPGERKLSAEGDDPNLPEGTSIYIEVCSTCAAKRRVRSAGGHDTAGPWLVGAELREMARRRGGIWAE